MNDDAQLPDDTELPDAPLVRPYVEGLGEPSSPAPALPATEQPTALLPRISGTMRRHGAARSPEAIEGEVVDAELPPTPMRTRFAVAAVGLVVVLVAVFVVWRLGGDGSSAPAPAPVAAVVPSLSMHGAPSVTPSASASRTPDKSTAKPTPTSASSSATTAPQPKFGGAQTPSGNLAAGRPVTDSGHTKGYVPSNVVDGDPNTYWQGVEHAFPQTLTIDLGAPTTVGRLVMKLPPQSDWVRRTESFAIEGSDKPHGKYATIVPLALLTLDPARGNDGSIQFHAAYRYIRIVFISNTGWPGAQASEIELYSS